MPVTLSNGLKCYSAYEVRDLCAASGFTTLAAETMGAIAMRESAGYTGAHNPKPPDDSYGLFQINLLAHVQHWSSYAEAVKCCTDAGCSAKFALSLYQSSGFNPWTTFTSNSLGPYLDANKRLKAGLPDAAAQFKLAVSAGFVPSGVTVTGGMSAVGDQPGASGEVVGSGGEAVSDGTVSPQTVKDAIIAASVLVVGVILFAIGANGVVSDKSGAVGKALAPIGAAAKTAKGAATAAGGIAIKAATGL